MEVFFRTHPLAIGLAFGAGAFVSLLSTSILLILIASIAGFFIGRTLDSHRE